MNNKYIKNKIAVSLFVLSMSIGAMFVADKLNIENVVNEQCVISEMTNKTLNISFVPNNPYMKNNVDLFNAITQTDISNIAKIQGVKSVKPISTEYNPLSGYLKINSKSSYVELYGINENGEDINRDNIEMIYGRSINSGDKGKNVIVLNMETINDMQIADAKSLIGTGVEINNTMYEVIGIMNVVLADERDNSSDLIYSSLIPKSTSKEIVARANSKASSYSAITVSVDEGANANAVETSIYNLLYQQHDNINGYYERDVEYNLPKKLEPTLTMLNSFIKYLKVSLFGIILLSLVALIKAFEKTKQNYEDEVLLNSSNSNSLVESKLENVEESEAKNVKELDLENEENIGNADAKEELLENKDCLETEVDNPEELKTTRKFYFLESNKWNILIIIFAILISLFVSTYSLSGKSVSNIFNISIWIKILTVVVSIYLIKLSKRG